MKTQTAQAARSGFKLLAGHRALPGGEVGATYLDKLLSSAFMHPGPGHPHLHNLPSNLHRQNGCA